VRVKVQLHFTTLAFFISLFSFAALAQDMFPLMPEVSITPGHMCERPDGHRYPGNIPFCRRNVSSGRKDAIVDRYDREFGYSIHELGRGNGEFKIDHLIPLCMGGSNSDLNLWPQHRTVYEQTDPWEQDLCIQIANGDISHQDAIDAIYRLKFKY